LNDAELDPFTSSQGSSVTDSDQPYIDNLVEHASGNSLYRTFTPFTRTKFETIWDAVGCQMNAEWNTGRGPRSHTTAKEAFFMATNVLHLPTKWDKHAVDFGLKTTMTEKTVWKIVQITATLLKAEYVCDLTMEDLQELNIICNKFSYVHHLTDATIDECNRPAGSHQEAKPYFSGKHYVYCLKTEVSTYPNGEASNWTKAVPGATSNITLMRRNLAYHKRVTRKTAGEVAVPDHGEASTEHPRHCATMTDKGYVGNEDELHVILPRK